MSDPLIHPVTGSPVQSTWLESPLMQAARTIIPEEHPIEVHPEDEPELDPSDQRLKRFTSLDIRRLLYRINPKGLSYEQVMGWGPLTAQALTPQEHAILHYLRRNRPFFERFAKLDGDPTTLSAEDMRIAAEMTGHALVFSPDEQSKIGEQAGGRASSLYPYSALLPHETPGAAEPAADSEAHWTATHMKSLLNQLFQAGVTWQQIQTKLPRNVKLSDVERRILGFLRDTETVKLLQPIARHYREQLSPEMIRAITSLIWNPAIYHQVPMIYSTHFADVDELDGVERLHTVVGVPKTKRNWKQYPKRKLPSMRVQLSAHELRDLFCKLHPGDGVVTLEMLRQYEPENDEERRILAALNQMKIFSALSKLDGESESVSLDDIQIALSDEGLVLVDSRLALLIVP